MFRVRVGLTLLSLCLVTGLSWFAPPADSASAPTTTAVRGRTEELEAALKQARATLNDAVLLRLCADAQLASKPSLRCQSFEPSRELSAMLVALDASTRATRTAWANSRNDIDLIPEAILFELSITTTQVRDLLTLTAPGFLPGIDRCAGGWLSADCLALKHGCVGDYKCYADGTCACYTCNNGSCGL